MSAKEVAKGIAAYLTMTACLWAFLPECMVDRHAKRRVSATSDPTYLLMLGLFQLGFDRGEVLYVMARFRQEREGRA